MERKEWKSLYLINKPTYFLGLRPFQWVVVCCTLFTIGWFAWWLALLLLGWIYYGGQRLARAHSSGHPDVLRTLLVRMSMKTYFEDRTFLFDKL